MVDPINLNIFAGTDKDLLFGVVDISGAVYDLTDCVLTFAVFDSSRVEKFRKSSGDQDEIEVTDLENGELTVHIFASDTVNIPGAYFYQLGIVSADGQEDVIGHGEIILNYNAVSRSDETEITAIGKIA